MIQQKKLTISRLIKFIESEVGSSTKNIVSDEINFKLLKYNESHIINDLPSKLKHLFDPFIKDFQRKGIKNIVDKNTSIYFSILTCIFNDFYNSPDNMQLKNIICFKNKLLHFFNNTNIKYDHLWKNSEIISSLNEYKNNKITLKLIADFFDINIFILNIKEDKIFYVSSYDEFNIFKMNIFLTYYNDNFEPLIYQNNSIILYNMDPVKKLVNVDKQFLNSLIDIKNKLNRSCEKDNDFDEIETESGYTIYDLEK